MKISKNEHPTISKYENLQNVEISKFREKKSENLKMGGGLICRPYQSPPHFGGGRTVCPPLPILGGTYCPGGLIVRGARQVVHATVIVYLYWFSRSCK